jgi:hypothetical protein
VSPRKKKAVSAAASPQSDVATLRPGEVAERLGNTFDPGGSLDYYLGTWVTEHWAAIDAAKALLEAPLTADISREFDRVTTEHAFDRLTPGEWCDLLEAQVSALRELEGAAEDIEAPDTQARDRLVKVAAISIACADVLEKAIKSRAA